MFFFFYICLSSHYIINQLIIYPIILINIIIIQLINKSGWAKPTYFYFFCFFLLVLAQMFKVCTKNLVFLSAKKNIKSFALLFFVIQHKCFKFSKMQKTKVQKPFALKNAKLLIFALSHVLVPSVIKLKRPISSILAPEV